MSVAGIPLIQSGFGILLDVAAQIGLSGEEGYRLGFASIAAALLVGTSIYATTTDIKPKDVTSGADTDPA